MSAKIKSWIGKTGAFEGEEGEGSVEHIGRITKENGDKIYVEGHDDITGWMNKSEVEER